VDEEGCSARLAQPQSKNMAPRTTGQDLDMKKTWRKDGVRRERRKFMTDWPPSRMP
jgi:hypothetical protein